MLDFRVEAMDLGHLSKGDKTVADAWPNVDLTSENVALAINNSLNHLLGYPHGQDSAWSQWISTDRSQLDDLLSRLRGSAGESYFERLM